ncbi:hypothetical protein F0342_10715 [Bacillus sp. CH30_1T]|uniref:hypothetical protein n=1 Tax=Bacillus sp. CH30_1T TaxID=2604836 RepID=UPI0011EE0084|nr:hypothetical protein [Bacillus sp. CH30_1T]KAA0564616.1 hypothetical protein F0342_10715 [Bacillus sp. CH30_1T]
MKKKIFYNAAFLITFIIVLYIGIRYKVKMENIGLDGGNSFSYTLFIIIFPILLGALLKFPNFLFSLLKTRVSKIDYTKLIIIGIPTLYISLSPLLIINNIFIINIGILQDPLSQILSGIVFGSILIESFKFKTDHLT